MRTFLIRRFLQAAVVQLLLVTVVFFLVRLAPGGPAAAMLSDDATAEEIEQFRTEMGFNDPLLVQYGRFLGKLSKADLGYSLSYEQPALSVVLDSLPATLELAIGSFIVSLIIALPVGVFAATRPNSTWDRISMGGVVLGQSMPTFWLGVMLIFLFSVRWRIFPTSGRGTLAHIILPSITLSTFIIALITRLVRSGLLDVLQEEYIRSARAKGLREAIVVNRHAFRNSVLPVITVLGLQVGTLLGGTVITETVFNWPGVGTLAIGAIQVRDYPLVQASVLVTGSLFVFVNILVDLLYAYFDPRIRVDKMGGG